MSRKLPCFFRWTFAVLTWLMLIGTAACLVVFLFDLPLGSHGHFSGSFEIPPGGLQVTINNGATKLAVTGIEATFSGKGDAELIYLMKHYALPLGAVYTVFFAALFDLLRRLFRNVQRGESFSPQTVRLVRIVGFSLIGFSLVSMAAEGLLTSAIMDYMRAHISGPGLNWTATSASTVTLSISNTFQSPVFFCGLLVLALSEVFRQGLALKHDADLTI